MAGARKQNDIVIVVGNIWLRFGVDENEDS